MVCRLFFFKTSMRLTREQHCLHRWFLSGRRRASSSVSRRPQAHQLCLCQSSHSQPPFRFHSPLLSLHSLPFCVHFQCPPRLPFLSWSYNFMVFFLNEIALDWFPCFNKICKLDLISSRITKFHRNYNNWICPLVLLAFGSIFFAVLSVYLSFLLFRRTRSSPIHLPVFRGDFLGTLIRMFFFLRQEEENTRDFPVSSSFRKFEKNEFSFKIS